MLRIQLRLIALLFLALMTSAHAAEQKFRPPAVPLITHDPYFSIWSVSDQLNTDWPRHWTGAINALCGQIRIDGKPYRYMGPGPATSQPMTQTSLDITPTPTAYQSESPATRVTLTFPSPLLPYARHPISPTI